MVPPEGDSERRETKSFFFDSAYDWNSKQRDVYNTSVAPIVESVLAGFNGTVFAYGQTGSGKTFTMEGLPTPDKDLQGVIPNSFDHIFNKIATDTTSTYLVRASYLEIYNEEVRDLLGEDPHAKLDLKERILQNGDSEVYVKDQTSFVVKEPRELDKIMEVGHSNRSVGRTDMNATSSRSHAIFTLTIEASEPGADGENHLRAGKLNLVDLAGSERQSKTKAEGIRLKEGAKINLSLVALGNVICALVDGNSSHVPYRDSKLTRLLQSSLGGSCKTLMFANFSPASYNFDETLGTLRYADRAKNIKNTPKINEDPKDALLREYEAEIKRLREIIAAKKAGQPIPANLLESASKSSGAQSLSASTKISAAETVQEIASGNNMTTEFVEQLRKQKADEVAKMLAEKGYAEQEISKIQQQLKDLEDATRRERRERDSMEKKLKLMEEKLVGGAKSLWDENLRKKAEMEQQQIKLAQQKAEEQRLARELEEKKKKAEFMGNQVSDLKKQKDLLTTQMKEMYGKYKSEKADSADLEHTFQQEREDLLDQIRELTSAVKLRAAVIRAFIPKEEVQKADKRLTWDNEAEEWSLKRLSPEDIRLDESAIPVMSPHLSRDDPYSGGRVMLLGNEGDSIAALEMPESRTIDYQSNSEERRIQAQVQAVLAEEQNSTAQITLRASENLPNVFLGSPVDHGGATTSRMAPGLCKIPRGPGIIAAGNRVRANSDTHFMTSHRPKLL